MKIETNINLIINSLKEQTSMRKHLLFALLGMVAMFTGCSQEDNLGSQSAGKVTSFTLAVDDGVETRAGVTEPADKPTRYIMEVYEATTSVGATQANQVVQSTNTFNVTLKDGQDYTILFWADYGTPEGSDNVFDATKLREVKIATGKVATKAAFAGVAKFKVGTDDAAKYTAVTLKHAVAQVKFSQTGALTATPSKLKVKYPESYSLNVEGYTTTPITEEVTHELACNAVTTGVIATDYIIASNEDNALMTIEATLDSEAKKDISNAPFRRDYTTTISGAYSDKYSATLTVSCDAEWSTDEDIVFPESSSPLVGDFYYMDNTYSSILNTDKECIGIVYMIESDKIKVVSLDEEKYNLMASDTWFTGRIQPEGASISPNHLDDLQHIYCAYVGATPTTWTDTFPVDIAKDSSAASKFNAAMNLAGTPFASGDYRSFGSSQGVSFVSGNVVSLNVMAQCSGRAIFLIPINN